jgi:hypothetical protein
VGTTVDKLMRGRFSRGHALILLIIVGCSSMAIITQHLLVTAATSAFDDLAHDLELAGSVERGLLQLTDASRGLAVQPDDLQRVRIARIQRELEPAVDAWLARAHQLRISTTRTPESNMTRFMGWLAQGATERIPLSAFETGLAMWRPFLQLDLDGFTAAARARGNDRLATASRMSQRARLGIIVLSVLALTIGVLGQAAPRIVNARVTRPSSK